ncbi:iron complex transport system ATP-binding protein [Lachnotalea glycerini]|uniref:ABC transporter ATP-binding protein n=1 Tax=Lachnotalea glycerini TaxID=1763509 RepID=A0A255ICA7_9FIRM|nr:ABC transporter ATP-binding protein [Lachnotalea glycerini]PXV91209.1 iron complex transport system ATP-binding protein [Lachnotalea glycerini]RDY31629.1 ABC transporter ATP-binding protein [Lachnotalea glycerini]
MNSIMTDKLDIAYEEALIVKQLNMKVPHGKITSIIGANGCGKSTVLKAVGRVLKPKQGTVYLNGEDIKKLTTKEVAKKMAILPQTPTAPSGLTVGQLVAYGRFPHQKGFGKLTDEDKKIVEWAIHVTKLDEYKDREVDTLSGGQRQRVWIAMALAQKADQILLDEPTTYLDMSHQLEILELLYDLNRNQGCTIVMVLHDLNLAARFSDHMIAISKGNIIKAGNPMEVMTSHVLKEVFNIDAKIVEESETGRPICITYKLLRGVS